MAERKRSKRYAVKKNADKEAMMAAAVRANGKSGYSVCCVTTSQTHTALIDPGIKRNPAAVVGKKPTCFCAPQFLHLTSAMINALKSYIPLRSGMDAKGLS